MFRLIPWVFAGSVLLINPAYSQQENTKFFISKQPCQPWQQMTSTFAGWEESVLFTGEVVQFDVKDNAFQSFMMFQVNQDSGTWSLLSIYREGVACLIASGNKFEPYVGK